MNTTGRYWVKSFFLILMMLLVSFAPLTASADDSKKGAEPAHMASRDLANSAWPVAEHDLKHTGLSQYDTAYNTGDLLWSFETGDTIRASAVIGEDGTIYVGSDDYYLYAIHPDGSLKWKFYAGFFIRTTPAVDSDGTIYIGSTDYNLYAISPDGNEKWRYTAPDIVYTDPVIGPDGTIYFGCFDHTLYAIDHDGSLKWSFMTQDYITSSVAIDDDGTIYVGSADGNLYAIDHQGALKWKYPAGHFIYSAPTIGGDGAIYFGSDAIDDGRFNAIDRNGKEIFLIRGENASMAQPSPAFGPDGTIYFGTSSPIPLNPPGPGDYFLYAISPKGDVKWRFRTLNHSDSSPAVGRDGSIYFGSSDNKVHALNPDGSQRWEFTTQGQVLAGPAITSNGTIIIGSADGRLYALGGDASRQRFAPSPPIELKAKAHNASVGISWSVPLDDGGAVLTGYRLYRGEASNEENYLTSLDPATSTYMDTDVENGRTYYYHVTALNKIGESEPSNEAFATPMVLDMVGPNIEIIYPTETMHLSKKKIKVVGTASDDVSLEKVEIGMDATNWALADGSEHWSADLMLLEGENRIYARATDTSGNYRTTSVNVTVGSMDRPTTIIYPFCFMIGLVGFATGTAGICIGNYLKRRHPPPNEKHDNNVTRSR